MGDVLNKLGTAFDQGVTQHRVDQINKFYNPNATLDYEGQGMTIACISDSFDDLTTAGRTAAAGVANFDLPGDGEQPRNTQPVVVLEDYASGGTDEGRAMCEIAYKMAPKARIGFATAFLGTVDFANNIRALAGLPGYTYPAATQQGFAADVICDDVSYEDEPFFQDGIIGRGVDDVAAAGVAYFSSAGNELPINAYASDFRPVPNGTGLTAATNPALVGTNINLANVPANLYAGGFHNFNPNGSLDVAQTVNIPNGNTTPLAFEWDDPYDQPLPASLAIDPTPIYSNTGTITTTNAERDLHRPARVHRRSGIRVQAGRPRRRLSTARFASYDPSGNLVGFPGHEHGRNAPVLHARHRPVLTVKITQLGSTGAFYAQRLHRARHSCRGLDGLQPAGVRHERQLPAEQHARHQQHRHQRGHRIRRDHPRHRPDAGAVRHRPGEHPDGAESREPSALRLQRQRRGRPRAGGILLLHHADHRRPQHGGGRQRRGGVQRVPPEHPRVVLLARAGHDLLRRRRQPARHARRCASSPPWRRRTRPTSRSSAAIPAAIPTPRAATSAARALRPRTQRPSRPWSSRRTAARHSLTPAQVTSILERSAFPHDLDPYYVSGIARASNGGKVTITLSSDADTNVGTGGNNTNAFTVAYNGPGALTSLVFNPEATLATAGNPTGGNNGVTYSTTGVGGTVTYFENSFPGMVFNANSFTLGSASTILAANVTATFSNLAPAPSTTQDLTFSLAFNGGTFTGGNILRFNVGRAIQHSAATTGTPPYTGATSTNYIADLLGGGVSLPSGAVTSNGMSFSGTLSDGSTFSGRLKNNIGTGYSALDGFGFINAQTAVSQTVQ